MKSQNSIFTHRQVQKYKRRESIFRYFKFLILKSQKKCLTRQETKTTDL